MRLEPSIGQCRPHTRAALKQCLAILRLLLRHNIEAARRVTKSPRGTALAKSSQDHCSPNPFSEVPTMSNHARNRTLKLVLVAAALFVSATASPAHAGGFRQDNRNCVPEIDASVASSAIALAVGGLALLRDRYRRR